MKIKTEDIILDSDPRIRTRSKKVELPLSAEDRELLEAMITYVRNSQDDEIAEAEGLKPAIGIAAIQLGIPKKMIAISIPGAGEDEPDQEVALANPRIVSRSVQPAYIESGEGCLSVENEHEGHVVRSARVKVRGYDLLTDQNVEIEAEGLFGICLQHETDHLSGVLFYDHIDPEDPFKEVDEAVVL